MLSSKVDNYFTKIRRKSMVRKSKSGFKGKRAGSKKRDKVIKSGGKTTINIPDGVELFIPKEKSFRLDVILYEAGEGNPCCEPGEWYYERTYYTHRVGPDNKYMVCPAKTAGKPCPVCEERARIAKDPDGDEDQLKDLRPSQRQLWLVRDRDDEDAGVKLFDFSFWNFGRNLDDLRKEADDDEEHISDFDDPDAGAILRVKFRESSGYGLEAFAIDFRPRPKGIDPELMNHGICLDDILVIPEYDALKNLFFQIDEEEEEEEEPKEKKRRSRKKKEEKEEEEEPTKVATADEKDIEEGSVVTHEEHGKCEVVRISRDGTSLILEDEEGDKHRAIGVDEVELVKEKKSKKEEEEEDDIPFDDDDDDSDVDDSGDDEDDDEEEEEPKKKSKKDDDDFDDDDDWDEDD
jgi:hypothetical protein